MNIGIVIAIEREFKNFLDAGYSVEEIKVRNYIIYHTNINNNDIYAIKSGYGKIDSSAVTSFLIDHFNVSMIINFGVAGALDKTIKVEDLFVVTDTVNTDYDVSPIDPVKRNQYEEFDDIYIPLTKSLIDKAKMVDNSLKEVICASGDRFVYLKDDKENLFEYTKGAICDMEIAGIARTCYINNVELLSIKCISDTFDGDGKDFNANVKRSSAKAFNFIDKFIKQL